MPMRVSKMPVRRQLALAVAATATVMTVSVVDHIKSGQAEETAITSQSLQNAATHDVLTSEVGLPGRALRPPSMTSSRPTPSA